MSILSSINLRWKPIGRIGRRLHAYVPEINFITLHYLYFIGTCLVASLILWGSATPRGSLPFTDALFLAISAMTEAGLNTVNLSQLNTFQQVVLFLLIFIGSAIFVSAFVVFVRRRAFDERFKLLARRGRWRHRKNSANLDGAPPTPSYQLTRILTHKSEPAEIPGMDGNIADAKTKTASEPSLPLDAPGSATDVQDESTLPQDEPETELAGSTSNDLAQTNSHRSPAMGEAPDHITFAAETRMRSNAPKDRHPLARVLSFSGVGARPTSQTKALRTPRSASLRRATGDLRLDRDRYVSSAPSISRNSTFYNLTEDDREYLGGNEYRAVRFLSYIVPLYLILWQLLGAIGVAAYTSTYYTDTTRANGLNPWWVGSFNAVSAFNNSGMSLLDANMTVFSRAVYILITMGLLILAGNTCYPVFLRLIVWAIYRTLPDSKRWCTYKETLKFLLDHPRRCYTNLFPSQHTWWLLLSVVMLNAIDCAFYALLNIGNPKITGGTPPGIEFINGLFQALAVRSGGFYIVPMSSVRISLQILYVIMMYISAFPVAITIRNSNVYEERSLGIYSDDPGYDKFEKELERGVGWFRKRFKRPVGPRKDGYFLSQQLRAQLAHDMWWVVLAVFLIMIVEVGQFERDPVSFSAFNVIFEVVSAYGCVGISIGLPDEAYSFCGAWHKLSKLILCAVMLRGRHRGLPVAIDKALLLPRERLHDLEDEDAALRSGGLPTAERTNTIVSLQR